MFQFLMFLVLLSSGKFSHEVLHVLDHEKNFLVRLHYVRRSVLRFKKLTQIISKGT